MFIFNMRWFYDMAYYSLLVDYLTYKGLARLRTASEYLKAVDKVTKDIIPNLKIPVMTIHSRKDTHCDFLGSELLYEKSPSKDRTLVEVCILIFFNILLFLFYLITIS